MQIAILGSAGSGKTLITAKFGEFLEKEGYTVKRLNLDPGVLSLPYEPDFDVRDYFTLEEIMRKENLGPNGAILEAMDRLSKLKLPSYNADYVLIDTPGQLEVFAFRDSGPAIFKDMKEVYGIFIIDATSSLKAIPGLLLYSLTIQYTLGIERIVNVVNKVDLIDSEKRKALNELALKFRTESERRAVSYTHLTLPTKA